MDEFVTIAKCKECFNQWNVREWQPGSTNCPRCGCGESTYRKIEYSPAFLRVDKEEVMRRYEEECAKRKKEREEGKRSRNCEPPIF